MQSLEPQLVFEAPSRFHTQIKSVEMLNQL